MTTQNKVLAGQEPWCLDCAHLCSAGGKWCRCVGHKRSTDPVTFDETTFAELQEKADKLIAGPEQWQFWRLCARLWVGEESQARRQYLNHKIVELAEEFLGDPFLARAYQRGMTAGFNAVMDVYAPPKRDA